MTSYRRRLASLARSASVSALAGTGTGTALLPPGRCLDRGGVPRGGVPRGGVELMDMKDAISCGKEGYIYGGDRRNLPA